MQAPKTLNPTLGVDAGEAEALCLAQEIKADAVLRDDRAGRSAALHCGLDVIGTVGLLEQAAARGLLDLPGAMERLQQTSARLDPASFRLPLIATRPGNRRSQTQTSRLNSRHCRIRVHPCPSAVQVLPCAPVSHPFRPPAPRPGPCCRRPRRLNSRCRVDLHPVARRHTIPGVWRCGVCRSGDRRSNLAQVPEGGADARRIMASRRITLRCSTGCASYHPCHPDVAGFLYFCFPPSPRQPSARLNRRPKRRPAPTLRRLPGT